MTMLVWSVCCMCLLGLMSIDVVSVRPHFSIWKALQTFIDSSGARFFCVFLPHFIPFLLEEERPYSYLMFVYGKVCACLAKMMNEWVEMLLVIFPFTAAVGNTNH